MSPGTPNSLLARVMADPGGDIDESEEFTARILAAAREVFARLGVQRASMEDVARSAGISRVTIYRRFASKDVLVEHVVRWEFRRYLEQFRQDIRHATSTEERVVHGFVSSLKAMRGNSLIGGLLAAEPGPVVQSMVGEHGRTMAAVRAFLAHQLEREQAAGLLGPQIDVTLVAELMVRVTTSFLVTPSEVVDLNDEEQLAAIARQFLVPMLAPPRSE